MSGQTGDVLSSQRYFAYKTPVWGYQKFVDHKNRNKVMSKLKDELHKDSLQSY